MYMTHANVVLYVFLGQYMRATPALIRCLQVNFSPNDGECVRPNTVPQNEFSAGALGGKRVSWRFFLNKNSNACKNGITTSAMIPTSNGGVRPLLLHTLKKRRITVHGFHCFAGVVRLVRQQLSKRESSASCVLSYHLTCGMQWGLSLFRFGDENRCDAA
jgi:hypothetical protein